MKRWVAVAAGVLFAFSFLWTYVLVERMGMDTQDLSSDNLQQLEKLILVNKGKLDMLQQQKDKLLVDIKSLMPITNEEDTSLGVHASAVPFNAAHILNSRLPLVSLPMCLHTSSPGAKPDVQVVDVIDSLPFDNPDGGVWKQGFELTYTEDMFDKEPLQVFVVPHSHNDPGWLQTFESYYNAKTRNILTNIVNGLHGYPERKFIWAEMSYLSMWWSEQQQPMKDKMIELIRKGQLEIVTGGWVMNDEANTHYFAMLDQMIEGHEWIKHNVGEGIYPKDGWAIDPFGHSPTMAYLLQRIGFDFMLIQRTHYTLKKYFAKNKILEFLWRQNWDHDGSTDMLCHMMPFYSYDVPHTCGPDPKICCQFDFRRLPGQRMVCPWRVNPVPINSGNVKQRAEMLLDQYRKKSRIYRTNVVLAPLGDDFRYDTNVELNSQFQNYDLIMNYVNSHPELKATIKFGTLSDYFNAVLKSAGDNGRKQPKDFPSVGGDFYTYTDRDDHYWSGYYTSRPFYKNLDRILESTQRAAEVLFSLVHVFQKKQSSSSFNVEENFNRLTGSRRSLGLFQHHDGITGTAREAVVNDYGQKLITSFWAMQHLMKEAAAAFIKSETPDAKITLKAAVDRPFHDSVPDMKPLLLAEKSPRLLVVYNPLAQIRTTVIKFQVDKAAVQVLDSMGNKLRTQINSVWESEDKKKNDLFEVLVAVEIPALGLSSLVVKEDDHVTGASTAEVMNGNAQFDQSQPPVLVARRAPFTLENAVYALNFNDQGLLQGVTLKESQLKFAMKVGFHVYDARLSSKDKPGAYLFMPNGPARPHAPDATPVIRIVRGSLCQEVTVFLPHVVHIVRLLNVEALESTGIVIENIADVSGLDQKEFVMRFETSIKNEESIYYTDLNGFQMHKRQYQEKIPLQGNFYPMPSMAFFEDSNHRFSILSGQPLGCASLKPGWFEVVLDRRLMQDDNRGLGQPIKDNRRTPSFFNLIIEKKIESTPLDPKAASAYPSLTAHLLSEDLLHPPVIMFSEDSWSSNAPAPVQPLSTPFPCNVFLLNLRSMHSSAQSVGPDSGLLLHNKAYDCRFNIPAICHQPSSEVHLGMLFRDIRIETIHNASLSFMYKGGALDTSTPINVPPMEIKAFKLRLQ